ncbi:hypothetical protein Q3G72_005610 [Acer saccharum]|nr:hypothetical protein Q3G72_005610 [Acer saccharum]
MGRERDRFWEYVEDLGGYFLCKFCERRFSGGITRIKSHLSGIRGRDIEICPKVPEDVQLAVLEAIGASTSASNKKAKTVVDKKEKSAVDKILAKFIISNSISLDLSMSPYLIDLLKSMAEFGPTYKFPNLLVLSTQLFPDIYEEAEEHIGTVKELSIKTGCTLVLSNVVKNSKLVCINILVYTPAGLVYVEKITVPEEGMTFSKFIDGIYSAIESLGPENIVQCIINITDDYILESITDFIDNSFFLSVQAMILRKYPWIYLSACASREFGILLVLTYLKVPWIHKTTQLAIVIYKYLYEHVIKFRPSKEHARNKEYSFAGQIQIAIEFFALDSILEVEKELQALQLPIASESCEEGVAEIVYNAINSNEFWSRGKKVVQVLQPLLKVLDFIDDQYGSTSGYLYEAMKKAEVAIEQQCDNEDDDDDRVHYEAIKKEFKEWRSRVVRPIHAAAAFLNPAYFCSENFTEDAEMQEGLQILTLFLPTAEQEAFSKQLQIYRMKMSDLFTDTAMKMLNTIHPRKWWECFGDHYPVLQNRAVQVLSQPCAAPTCHRCNFEPNDLVDTLRMNTILMEHFSTLKSRNWEPVDLDRTSGLPEYAHEIVKSYLEKKDWWDDINYRDLLVINETNDRFYSSLEPNVLDELLEFNNTRKS